jgi:MOSC domain-containing protein YiiM
MAVPTRPVAKFILNQAEGSGKEEIVRGQIVQLNLKPREGRARGLPKRAASRLTITAEGVEGDYNRWRTEKANGDPDQAVLLLSEEILAGLQAEGWPVQPGDLGENVTVAGLPPDALRNGAVVRLGEVVLEVSKPCDPCTVLFTLPYVGVERGPEFLRVMVGRRGWFARVLQGGTVGVDTAVEVMPREVQKLPAVGTIIQ